MQKKTFRQKSRSKKNKSSKKRGLKNGGANKGSKKKLMKGGDYREIFKDYFGHTGKAVKNALFRLNNILTNMTSYYLDNTMLRFRTNLGYTETSTLRNLKKNNTVHLNDTQQAMLNNPNFLWNEVLMFPKQLIELVLGLLNSNIFYKITEYYGLFFDLNNIKYQEIINNELSKNYSDIKSIIAIEEAFFIFAVHIFPEDVFCKYSNHYFGGSDKKCDPVNYINIEISVVPAIEAPFSKQNENHRAYLNNLLVDAKLLEEAYNIVEKSGKQSNELLQSQKDALTASQEVYIEDTEGDAARDANAEERFNAYQERVKKENQKVYRNNFDNEIEAEFNQPWTVKQTSLNHRNGPGPVKRRDSRIPRFNNYLKTPL